MFQRLPFHVGLNTLNPLPHSRRVVLSPGGGGWGAYNPKIFANLPVITKKKKRVGTPTCGYLSLPSKSSEC